MTRPDYAEKIPNNVGLAEDRRLQRALESWQPDFLSWWESMGPTLPTQDVYLRTAIDVRGEGWAQFGHVPMLDYRWGIFLADKNPDRRIAFGAAQGRAGLAEGAGGVPGRAAAADRDPGRHRAGVGGAAAQPRRDRAVPVRPAQPVPGQRGRGPSPVGDGVPAARLLRPRGPRGGRGAAAPQLRRRPTRRGSSGAFNEETPDWLSFFMFTYFTDRDGKYQLGTLKESAFDPLSPHLRVHAQGRGAPHDGRHHRRRPGGGADRAGDGGERHRRRGRARRDPAAGHPEVPELPLQRLARPVRRGDLHQRRQLLHRRAQGPLAGRAPQGRPPAHRRRDHGRRAGRRGDRPGRGDPPWSASTPTCGASTSPTAPAASSDGTGSSTTPACRSGCTCRTSRSTGRSGRSPPSRRPPPASSSPPRSGKPARASGCPPTPTRRSSGR